jgi:protease-4
MRQFFKFTFATMLGLFLFSALMLLIFVGIVSAGAGSDKVNIEPNSVLHLTLSNSIMDRASNNPFEDFDFMTGESNSPIGLNELLSAIRQAKDEDNVKGIFLDISFIPSGMATMFEVREALKDFKESGKFVYSYSEVYSQSAYYLASVSDSVFIHPTGMMEMKGIMFEVPFIKGTLEKIGIEPQVIRHGKFKSAIEPLVNDEMSPENREQMTLIATSLWNQMVADMAESRGVTAEEINRIASELLIRNAEDAVKYGMADRMVYKDEMDAALSAAVGTESVDDISLIAYSDLNAKMSEGYSKDKIAVIYAQGDIIDGEGSEYEIGSIRISEAIREARLDDQVKAIVLRVNSPGGSAQASEVIWREVALAREAKPVIVSMGDLAASGGYYISCAADEVYCSPLTITGSIGVFGVIPNMEGLVTDKLGVKFDQVMTNDHADFFPVTRPMTDFEKEVIQQSIEEIYSTFVSRVSAGREISPEMVDSIGQGRVWSGVNALDINLVDGYAGLMACINTAAEMAELDKYRIVELPEQKDPFTQIMESFGAQARTDRALKARLGIFYEWYVSVEKVMKQSGIQARMPYEFDLR